MCHFPVVIKIEETPPKIMMVLLNTTYISYLKNSVKVLKLMMEKNLSILESSLLFGILISLVIDLHI